VGTVAPILIGGFVGAIVIVIVRRVLRERRPHGARLATEVTLVVVGLLMMVLSVVVGQRVLAVKEPPRGEQFAAGVGIVPGLSARPNRGFMASLGARFRSCDEPVDVTIVLAGSAEYFEDRESGLRRRRAREVMVGVPGKDLEDLRMGYGSTYFDLFVPFRSVETQDAEVRFTAAEPRERRAVTSIAGRMAAWADHMAPIVVRFKADWLVPRGLGTCYLRLPALVGTSSVIGAQDARGRSVANRAEMLRKFPKAAAQVSDEEDTIFVPYDTGLTTIEGVSVVDPGKNDLLSSQPETQVITGGRPGLSCTAHSPRTGELGDKRAELVLGETAGVAMRHASFPGLASELDCGGVFTMAEAGAGNQRDLVLLLIGAFFSLGAALLLEMGLDIQRRRFEVSRG
jgi:hypothetical protein